MCGIFGYTDCEGKRTQKEICEAIIEGLEAVEYRGYDSAGACVLKGSEIAVYKKAVGKVEKLKSELEKINKTSTELGTGATKCNSTAKLNKDILVIYERL